MPKAIVICREILSGTGKGRPDVGTGWRGFVYVGTLPGAYAVYIITGTGPQLTAIDAHANTIGGLLVTGSERWAELDVAIPTALRTKINTYRTAQGLSTIPASTTLLQVLRFAANHYDYGNFDVTDNP